MAKECVDVAVRTFGLEGKVKSGCVTDKVRLVGSDGWSRNMFIGLIQRVTVLYIFSSQINRAAFTVRPRDRGCSAFV